MWQGEQTPEGATVADLVDGPVPTEKSCGLPITPARREVTASSDTPATTVKTAKRAKQNL
jgi:hypothetical protein